MSISSQIKIVQTTGKRVSNTAITTTFTATVVNRNVQLHVQSVKSRPFVTLPKYITQENQRVSEQTERKQKQKLEDFTTDKTQVIYSYDGG